MSKYQIKSVDAQKQNYPDRLKLHIQNVQKVLSMCTNWVINELKKDFFGIDYDE